MGKPPLNFPASNVQFLAVPFRQGSTAEPVGKAVLCRQSGLSGLTQGP
jgi:hypothetical protein